MNPVTCASIVVWCGLLRYMIDDGSEVVAAVVHRALHNALKAKHSCCLYHTTPYYSFTAMKFVQYHIGHQLGAAIFTSSYPSSKLNSEYCSCSSLSSMLACVLRLCVDATAAVQGQSCYSTDQLTCVSRLKLLMQHTTDATHISTTYC